MSGPSPLNIVFAVFFVLIGVFMTLIGVSFLFSGPGNETEWTITLFSLAAAAFLFIGAAQTWRNHFRQQNAERKEAERLAKKFGTKQGTQKPMDTSIQETIETQSDGEPKILARWLYPKKEWNRILTKLAEKTQKEEMYTAFWFPVIFALVFWSLFWVGILIGLAFGFIYIRFRTNYVRRIFEINSGMPEAEVIVTDSYLRINGNFVHYGDGKYFLKNILKTQDKKLGQLLLFEIGWITSKGLPAQLDLYLPIAESKLEEADDIIETFKRARS